MFGLTRREQYWAEQRKAAELLTEITCAALKAQAEIQVAEVHSELKALRTEIAEMRQLLKIKNS